MARMALLLLAFLVVPAVSEHTAAQMQANPIRKVVTMLQKMQETVEAEGKKEEELFEKYMCYCKSGRGQLEAGIAASETKISELSSGVESGEGESAQLKEDLKSHSEDRTSAKAAMAEAATNREKEAAAFAAESAEYGANIAAMKKALAAIEKGVGGAFLQTDAAQIVRQLVQKNNDLFENDREEVMSFLSQGNEEGSDEIIGILKTMLDEMAKGLSESEATEKQAIADFNGLTAAKTKEVGALTTAIEEKTQRAGQLSVDIVEMKNELGDTEEAVVEDKKFVADLESNCAAAQKMWDERCKLRQEELLALADTIKMLNDDDALQLFKKTLPGASASFVQLQVTSASMRASALSAIRPAQRRGRPALDFIALAIEGKKGGLDKVVKMIDGLIANLKKEQEDDDKKKEYCAEQFDLTDDKKKELEGKVEDLETVIAKTEDAIAQAKTDIEALDDGIKALDKSVAEATEQRKEENEEYTSTMAANAAAKELIGMAKNRMNKFYNPKMYKAPPKRELTEEEQATLAAGGTLAPTMAPGGIAGTGVTVFAQIKSHRQSESQPELNFGGSKKEESGGVLAMMDLMVKEVDTEMVEMEAEEKDAQGDYEKMMADSKEKRAEDSKLMAEKAAATADMEADLQKATEDKTATAGELAATRQYLASLHGECDWLLKFFDQRQEARHQEMDAMGMAKAELSGADLSLIQRTSKNLLRHVKDVQGEQSCSAADLKNRMRVQNKLAGLCEDMCKEVGAYPKCAACPSFVAPDPTPGVMTWDELLTHMDNLADWGKDELKAWGKQAR